jgi:hypothetical protein
VLVGAGLGRKLISRGGGPKGRKFLDDQWTTFVEGRKRVTGRLI